MTIKLIGNRAIVIGGSLGGLFTGLMLRSIGWDVDIYERLLMCVAFIPYPTALIGEYGSSLPVVVFYGLSLAITGFAYNALWFYVVRCYIKTEKILHPKVVQKATIWTLSYPVSYLIAAGWAFMSINLSVILYALIPAFYLLSGIIDKQLMEQA